MEYLLKNTKARIFFALLVFCLGSFLLSEKFTEVISNRKYEAPIDSLVQGAKSYMKIGRILDRETLVAENMAMTKQCSNVLALNTISSTKISTVRPKNATTAIDGDRILEIIEKTTDELDIETTKNECLPRNVAFIKTHKTAGTTVQNVFIRYGVKRHLKFALPNKGWFGYPGSFSSLKVLNPELQPFNIICHHMRFNYKEVKKIMAINPLFITVIREPGELFQSSFDFFYGNVPQFHNVPHRSDNGAEKWLDLALKAQKPYGKTLYSHFSRNHLMFDLGFSSENIDKEYISKAIQQIDSIFDLVLISDYMDQSLVLLADLLCLPMEEVATLRLNKRDQDNIKGEAAKRISDKARRWNKADAALFDYFNKTLWRKIEKYGFEKMSQKIDELHTETEKLKAKCIVSDKPVPYGKLNDTGWTNKLYQPKGVKVTSFQLKPEAKNNLNCQLLVMPESVAMDMLKNYQKQMYFEIH